MRVLVGPRIDLESKSTEVGIDWALAGSDGAVVSLGRAGVRNLSRPLTQAELVWLRQALSGKERPAQVGYVCKGVRLASTGTARDTRAAKGDTGVIAVTDHVNLTPLSPLVGPNDDRIGPRFSSLEEVYAPDVVRERVEAVEGIIVEPSVVAGVGEDGNLNAYEARTAGAHGYTAASSELVPVIIVAAHMGMHVAVAVVAKSGSQQEETGCGRS